MALLAIPLDSGWQCAYFATDQHEVTADGRVASISSWSFDPGRVAGWKAWLLRQFTLQPTDFCVRYFLVIDSAPQSTQILVNDRYIGDCNTSDDGPPFEVDVTDYVWLKDNTIAFRVGRDSKGKFAGIRLQPVPCESQPE